MSKTSDLDTGCSVLDLISAVDNGQQEEAIDEEFGEARRRVLQLGGGKTVIAYTAPKVVPEGKN